MNDLVLTAIARHGYALTFAFLFGQAMGLPLPASIALIAAGAAIASHTLVGHRCFAGGCNCAARSATSFSSGWAVIPDGHCSDCSAGFP